MSDINLLPKATVGSLQEKKVDAVFRRVSFVILFATALISLVLFILVWQSPLSKVKEEENTLLSSIARYSNQTSRNAIIQERLQSIAQVITTRPVYEKDLQVLFSLLPSDVSISAISISKNTLQLTGNATSLQSINSFFDSLVDLKNKKEIIQSVLLQSFVFQSETGAYSFTFQITLL